MPACPPFQPRLFISIFLLLNQALNSVYTSILLSLQTLCRYRDGTSQEDSVVQWLWQTLESFTVEERILFLRFVSGRSRLPTRVSEIPQRFQISVASGQVNFEL